MPGSKTAGYRLRMPQATVGFSSLSGGAVGGFRAVLAELLERPAKPFALGFRRGLGGLVRDGGRSDVAQHSREFRVERLVPLG